MALQGRYLTPVNVVNLALGYLNLEQITALDDNTELARTADLNWSPCRRAFLQEYEWGFATRAVALALRPESVPLWRYAYGCPSDLVSAIRVTPNDPHAIGGVDFRIMVGEDGDRVLCCNMADPVLEYISDAVNLSAFSPLALEALAVRLAFAMGQSLKHDPSELQTLWQTYQTTAQAAAAKDARMRGYEQKRISSYTLSREVGLAADRHWVAELYAPRGGNSDG